MDFEEFFTDETNKYTFHIDYGDGNIPIYAITLSDNTTGSKIMTLDDTMSFNPQSTMTVSDAIKTALRYYNSFANIPHEVTLAEAGESYNKDILRDELMEKNSSLPDCSNEYLPQWNGLLIPCNFSSPMFTLDEDIHDTLTKKEIELIKDAGFDYIGLAVNYSNLQYPYLANNTVNKSHMEHLDQILAWCIEYDIHLDIKCASAPGADRVLDYDEEKEFTDKIYTDEAFRQEFADFWQMIASRYADIPNKYLSFNLLMRPRAEDIYTEYAILFNVDIPTADRGEYIYAETFKPVIERIQEVSPDRCMIVDINNYTLTGTQMARLGVALSYHVYDPRSFTMLYEEVDAYESSYLESVTWPYVDENGKVWDAKAMLKAPMFNDIYEISLTSIIDRVNYHGVGYMVGEWGIYDYPNGMMFADTYNTEVLHAFYTDMITELNELNIGWVLSNNYYGEYGFISTYPDPDHGDFIEVEGTNLYLETEMYESIRKR